MVHKQYQLYLVRQHIWHKFNKVVREDPNSSIQLPLPPALVLNLLGDDLDDLEK